MNEQEVTYDALLYQNELLYKLGGKVCNLLTAIAYLESDDMLNHPYAQRSNAFMNLLQIASSYNRNFVKLLGSDEPITALAIIRLQMDNLKCLYAEYLYPNKILHKIYENGRELSQIKIKGKNAASKEIIGELIEEQTFTMLWNRYSKFVHPDREQTKVRVQLVNNNCPDAGMENGIEIPLAQGTLTPDDITISMTDKNKLSRDMVIVIQRMISVFVDIIAELEVEASEKGILDSEKNIKAGFFGDVFIKKLANKEQKYKLENSIKI